MRADVPFMRRALALARRGRGWVNPNPMVGAVVVRDGAVVGEGYHERIGGPHAEVVALAAAGELARGATLYVSLEPCNHHGRTPPCTAAIARAGVRRVVFACWDEHPRTARLGARALADLGIEVVPDVEAAAARELNRPFFKFARSGMPYVLSKMAMSLDGKIATSAGRSRWITGPEARDLVQEWRATYAAVMVGIGTVLADDPALTCRLEGARSPTRVVVDPLAQTPPDARLIRAPGQAIVAVGPTAPADALDRLRAAGAAIVVSPLLPGTGAAERAAVESLDLGRLLRELAAREISSVLAEGGGGLTAALVRQGVVDRVAFFVAPLLIGGRNARTALEGIDIVDLDQAVPLHAMEARPIGADWLIEADLQASNGV